MTKNEFLTILTKELALLEWSEVEKTLAYYDEIINDRMENGESEEQAVESLGNVYAIASQILAEANVKAKPKEPEKRKQTSPTAKALAIILIILGFPLWFPLLISGIAVVLAIFITLWAVAVGIAVAVAAVGIVGIFLFFRGIIGFFASPFVSSVIYLGGGLVGIGACMICVFAVYALFRAIASFTSWLFKSLASLFKKRGESVEKGR